MASAELVKGPLSPEISLPSNRQSWWDRTLLAGVALFALAVAWPQLTWFWDHSYFLWYNIVHDRHTHYMHGLDLAMDVRHGNLPGLISHLDGLRTWGPLQSLLIAPVELLMGPDHRFAVLPSWFAWIGSVILCFLIARRLAPAGGNFAGLVAALFFALSPSHKAFATDIMLESLGCFLSLLCLYCYLLLIQDGKNQAAFALGISLTLIFLQKSNYWILVLLGLGAAELLRQPRVYWNYWIQYRGESTFTGWLARQVRKPLNYVLLACLAVAGWVLATGGTDFHLFGIPVSMNKTHNLVHAAYICFFIQLAAWWRSPWMRNYRLSLPKVFRRSVVVHLWAVAIYFLLPKRLALFLYYNGPCHGDQMFAKTGFLQGIPYYSEALMQDFHIGGWSFALALVFFSLALISFFTWRKGSGAVVCFLGLSALLACQHPLTNSRFLTTWIASFWIIGAAGLATTLYWLFSWRKELYPAIATLLLASLVGLHYSHLGTPGRAPEGGIDLAKPSVLPATEAFLAELKDCRYPTLVSNLPIQGLLSWTYQERYRRQKFETNIRHFEPGVDDSIFQRWLKTTRADTLVLIDIPSDSPFYCLTTDNRELQPLRDFLAQNRAFEERKDYVTPEKVRITLLTRTPQSTAQAK